MKHHVVVLRPISENLVEKVEQVASVEVLSDRVHSEQYLQKRLSKATIVVSQLTEPLNRAVLQAAPNLQLIVQFAVGYDNIDLEYASKQGVVVAHTPGVLSAPAVAEHCLALTLAVQRNSVAADAYVRQGKYKRWDPGLFLGQGLHGKTVGIVGGGSIGQAFAEICHNGFRCRIVYADIQRNEFLERNVGALRVGLEKLLVESDVVSLHVPLLPSTKHLIGKSELSLMKPTAVLINTARGPVVKEAALVQALKKHVIAGAGLDVFEHEPELSKGLVDLPNVVLSPHIGSATGETRAAMACSVVHTILAFCAEEPIENRIN
jgi:glyoxylate reductase